MIVMTLVISSFLVFALSEAAPGDSSAYVLAEGADDESREMFLAGTGQDRPFGERYLEFLLSFLRGEWGQAAAGYDIRSAVAGSAGVTLSLTAFSLVLSLVISVPLSLFSASRGKVTDRAVSFLSLLIMSLPSFLTAMLLVLLLAMRFPLFPVAGFRPPAEGAVLYLRSLFLPSLTLALLHSSLYLRVFRKALAKGLESEYSRFALSVGMKRRELPLKSAFRPALPVLSSLAAEAVASSLGGAAVIETVFALPGLGSLMVDAALSRDARLAGTIMILVSGTVAIVFFLLEGLLALLDPRIRKGGE